MAANGWKEHLSVGIIPVYPYVIKVKSRPNGNTEADGVAIQIIKLLAQSLNFTYSLSGSSESTFGDLYENGTWTGQMGKLQNKEVDILCPLAQGAPWNIGATPTKTLAFTCSKILGAVGLTDATNFAAFLSSFDPEIWYYFVSLIFVTIIISAFSDVISRQQKLTRSNISKELVNYTWMMISATFCEGSFKVPTSRRSQLLLGIWLLAILTLTNAFVSQFKAILMSIAEEPKINTVKDLAQRPDVIPFFPAQTIMTNLFESSTEQDYRQVWENALRKEGVMHISKMSEVGTYQRVKDGEGVVLLEPFGLKSFLMEHCHKLLGKRRFYLSEQDLFQFQICFSERDDTPGHWLRKVDDRIQWLMEGHLITKLLEDSTWMYGRCEEMAARDDISLKFHHLRPVFYLLLISNTLATCLLFTEILVPLVATRSNIFS